MGTISKRSAAIVVVARVLTFVIEQTRAITTHILERLISCNVYFGGNYRSTVLWVPVSQVLMFQ